MIQPTNLWAFVNLETNLWLVQVENVRQFRNDGDVDDHDDNDAGRRVKAVKSYVREKENQQCTSLTSPIIARKASKETAKACRNWLKLQTWKEANSVQKIRVYLNLLVLCSLHPTTLHTVLTIKKRNCVQPPEQNPCCWTLLTEKCVSYLLPLVLRALANQSTKILLASLILTCQKRCFGQHWDRCSMTYPRSVSQSGYPLWTGVIAIFHRKNFASASIFMYRVAHNLLPGSPCFSYGNPGERLCAALYKKHRAFWHF